MRRQIENLTQIVNTYSIGQAVERIAIGTLRTLPVD